MRSECHVERQPASGVHGLPRRWTPPPPLPRLVPAGESRYAVVATKSAPCTYSLQLKDAGPGKKAAGNKAKKKAAGKKRRKEDRDVNSLLQRNAIQGAGSAAGFPLHEKIQTGILHGICDTM